MTKEYVIEIYNKLHKIPETAFNEFKTSNLIAKELEKFGYEYDKINPTGVVATLDSSKPGPVFGLRADIDALPYIINDKKINMHTCGHDAHTAMVLAAAKEIKESGGISKGKLILVFQPAEEELGGADAVINSGKIDILEELVGIHLRPIQEASLGEATPALMHGGGCALGVKVKGIAAHGARPHLGISSIDAAITAVNAVNAIRVDPNIAHSIKVTKVQTEGSAGNIIPDTTNMIFDIRAQTNEIFDRLLEKAKTVITNSVEAFGASVEFSQDGTPAADYNDELVKDTAKAIESVLGSSLPPLITPGCEDFHYFTIKKGIKTAYIGLGADLKPGLHHPEMSFNLNSLVDGKDILKALVFSKLNN